MPQDHPEDPMHTDAVEETQSTQQATQETQLMSQIDGSVDEHLWGMLIPCNANLHRIDFQKVKRIYSVGRNDDSSRGGNDIVFPGMKISNYHCRIEWDGQKGPKSAVKVTDLSSNGTFINQQKIGKNMTRLLYDGNELSFGTWQPQFGAMATQDYPAATLRGIFKYYQLHETLGTGSFATVTKAIHRETGVWYAVKTMERKRLRTASNAQAHNDAAFSREINILEDLQHPRICGLKEVFYEEHTINLILELIQGGDLLDYILDSENQRLTESLSQHITYQICDALQYIHSKGIAHRDLKPENVLLTRDNPPLVKVADFGLAKAVDSMTMLRTMCGTPSYLAPEVVLQKNCDGYDHLVDSWSVGVIVFCMLTGSNPFPDETGELATRVLSREVDWDCFQTTCPSHPHAAFLFAGAPLAHPIPLARGERTPRKRHPARRLAVLPVCPLRRAEDDNANADADADASMDSGHAETNGGDSQMHEEPPVGSQLPGLPGAYPQSQQLQRRSVALLQQLQQERGEEEVVVSEDEGVGEDEPVGPLVRGTKRKAALVFEGSLTPMEEEEEDPNAMPVSPRAVRTAPAHGRKARGAAGPSTHPPRANTTRGGRDAAGTTPNGTRRSERLVNGPAGRHRK
ncbi:hypothetical protein EVJ58_g8242 [Rhodofomes roseus]|uniref:Non-specific serine/threonine protein kinase n=1 Tax=Rhodofomes roseus TaxID=34475 RepID=A0A4Y9Y164_9APHY|nr:hypothetical protein EVJ58_g8242 [Rhodofomes roseus]